MIFRGPRLDMKELQRLENQFLQAVVASAIIEGSHFLTPRLVRNQSFEAKGLDVTGANGLHHKIIGFGAARPPILNIDSAPPSQPLGFDHFCDGCQWLQTEPRERATCNKL